MLSSQAHTAETLAGISGLIHPTYQRRRRRREDDMPATSEAQRRMMAIAEHHPGKLHTRNRGVLSMSKGQLSDYASTKEKGLPKKKRNLRGIGSRVR